MCPRATPLLQFVQFDGEARCAPQQSPVTVTFALNVGFTPETRLVLVFTVGHKGTRRVAATFSALMIPTSFRFETGRRSRATIGMVFDNLLLPVNATMDKSRILFATRDKN